MPETSTVSILQDQEPWLAGPRSQIRRMGTYLGAWTLVTIYILSAQLFLMRQPLYSDTFLKFTGLTLVRNYGWALLSLLTLALLRAFPLHRKRSPQTWLVHLAGSVLVTMIGLTMMAAVIPMFYVPRLTFLPRVWSVTKQNFHFCYVIYYWGLVGFHEGIQLYHHLREKRQAALRLQSELAQAQLHALETHLSPHFLFNALNAVAALIHADPKTADQILLRLSSLLRSGLSRSGEQTSTLKEELDYLESYLAIEHHRFGPRLQVEFQIPSSLQEAEVPSFLLQPLMEIIISRCVAPRALGGRVALRAWTEAERLIFEVESRDPCSAQDPVESILLSRMASRLELLHGLDQSLLAVPTPGGGFLFRVSLPLSTSNPTLIPKGESA